MMRMMSGIGMPRSQSRMGMMIFLFVQFNSAIDRSGTKRMFTPGAIAEAAALRGRKRGTKRADEKRQRQPDRDLHCSFPRLVHIRLDLRRDVVDALFRVLLA